MWVWSDKLHRLVSENTGEYHVILHIVYSRFIETSSYLLERNVSLPNINFLYFLPGPNIKICVKRQTQAPSEQLLTESYLRQCSCAKTYLC